RAHPILSKERFYTDAEIHWFSQQGGLPNWSDKEEKQFGCLIHEDEQQAPCLMFNAGADAVNFSLPPVLPGTRWHLAVDTSHEAPQDLFAAGEEPPSENPQTYHLSPQSSAVLLARGTNGQRFQTALPEAEGKECPRSRRCFWISAASCLPMGGIIIPADARRLTSS